MLQFITKSIAPPNGFPYTQPETQMVFRTLSWDHMLSCVRNHRAGVNSGSARYGFSLDLEAGWQERLEHDICLTLPEGVCKDPQNPEPYRSELEKRGRALWKELHEYTLSYPEKPSTEETKDAQTWFQRWMYRIPNFERCSCLKTFQGILDRLPLDLASRSTFYERTVQWHNEVNQKLGKPVWIRPDTQP